MEIKPLSSPLSIFFDIWNTSSWRCLHLIWEQGQSVHKLTRGECRAMITFVISQLSAPHTLLLPFIFIRYYSSLFSFNLRYFFAFHSMPKRSSIEEKAKFYRTSIEHLSNRACGNFLMPLFLQSLSVALIYWRFMIHYSSSCDGQYAALLRIIHFGDEWIADSLLFNLSH